jgi:hypothetical protein
MIYYFNVQHFKNVSEHVNVTTINAAESLKVSTTNTKKITIELFLSALGNFDRHLYRSITVFRMMILKQFNGVLLYMMLMR